MQVLQLVPTAPSRMVSTVAAGIPYKLRDRDAQCTYLYGALQLAEKPAAAAVREGILAAAVNHLLGLDVEIRWQDIAAAEAGIPGRSCLVHAQLLGSRLAPVNGSAIWRCAPHSACSVFCLAPEP